MIPHLSTQKLRLFCITNCPPIPTMGGAMAFYRHFVERNDFEIRVATNCANFPYESVPYQPLLFGPSQLTNRLFQTRWMPWLYGFHLMTAFGRVPAAVWQAARDFKPDAIFTIAGTWDYSALIAQRVAQRLRVPLIASFNDWFNFGWFPPHPVFHSILERRFRQFYHAADLALCTCEGMRESLGAHANAHVLYPIGSPLPEMSGPFQPFRPGGRRVIVGFAGNLGEWYGPMVDRLIKAAQNQRAPIEFRIYGKNPALTLPNGAGCDRAYQGLLPFDKLKAAMAETDLLLLPMGFEPRAALIERTSFKTKFLDYLSYRKPILVWGPEYCSAVRAAREFDSAELCTQPEAASVVAAILALADSPERQTALVDHARRMYEDRFSPDKIHAGLVRQCRQLLAATGI